ncbi:MAG: CPBP family glutamic-type intramembrane protease [Propionibacteriaceae bacterium]|nr:CPBP family glutamic-type intramembrane protease [Propionibacteriaceae bacterium]
MSYPAYGTYPPGAPVSSYPGPAQQYPGGYGFSGQSWPEPVQAKLFLPTQLKDSMRFFQVPARRWWWGLIGLVVFVVLFYGMQVAVGFGVGLSHASWTKALLQGITTPATFLLNNVILAVIIPVAVLVSWLFFRQGFGWLSSVVGRFRWKWLFIPLGIFAAGYAVETALEIILAGPTDYGLHDLQFKSYTGFMIIAILLTTPFQCAGEEFMARGLLPRLVTSIIPFRWVGLVLSAVLPSAFFMYLHDAQDPWLNANYFCVALLMWWLAYRTGGIEASIALHVVNNIFSEWTLPFTDFSGLMDRSDGSAGPGVLIYLVIQLILVVLVDIVARRRGLVRLSAPGAATPQVVKPKRWVAHLTQIAQTATKADLPRFDSTVREQQTQYSWLSAIPSPQRGQAYVPAGYLPYGQTPGVPPMPTPPYAPAAPSASGMAPLPWTPSAYGGAPTPGLPPMPGGAPTSGMPPMSGGSLTSGMPPMPGGLPTSGMPPMPGGSPTSGMPQMPAAESAPPNGLSGPLVSPTPAHLLYGSPPAPASVNPSFGPPATPPSTDRPPGPSGSPWVVNPPLGSPMSPPSTNPPAVSPASPAPAKSPSGSPVPEPMAIPATGLPISPSVPLTPAVMEPSVPPPNLTSPTPGLLSPGSDQHQFSTDTIPRPTTGFTPPTGSPAVFSPWAESPSSLASSPQSESTQSPSLTESGDGDTEPAEREPPAPVEPPRPAGPPPWPVTAKSPGITPLSSPFTERPPFKESGSGSN